MPSPLELEPERQAAAELLQHLMGWQITQQGLLDAKNTLAVRATTLTLFHEVAPESALWADTAQSLDDIARSIRDLRSSVDGSLLMVLPPHPSGMAKGLEDHVARLDRQVIEGELQTAFSLIAWDAKWRTIDSLRDGQWFKIDGPVELVLSFDPRLAPELAARMSLQLEFKFPSVNCRYVGVARGGDPRTAFALEQFADVASIAMPGNNGAATFRSGLLTGAQQQCCYLPRLAPWVAGVGIRVREAWYRLTLTG